MTTNEHTERAELIRKALETMRKTRHSVAFHAHLTTEEKHSLSAPILDAEIDLRLCAALLEAQRPEIKPQADVRVPDGYVLVPVEPTPEMCRALFINLVHADDEARVIKAVISAAPQPAAQTQEAANAKT